MKVSKANIDIVSIVKGKGLFKELSDKQIALLCKDVEIQTFKTNETVFYQSDSSTDLYIILHGSVKAVLIDSECNELVLAIMSEGDFFGEMSLLDGKPRSASVITLQDSTFAVLKRERFLTAIYNQPAIAVQLLASLVQRLRITDDMLGAIAFLDVSQRIMKILKRLISEKGEFDSTTGMYKIKKIPHKELAALTGSSREAVSKAMKILHFKNIVKGDDNDLFVKLSNDV